jgi:hypothetical protein
MIKNFVLFSVCIFIFIIGCTSNSPTIENTPVNPTPTPAFYIDGKLIQNDESTTIDIRLNTKLLHGFGYGGDYSPVSGATIFINSYSVIEESQTPGIYSAAILGNLPEKTELNIDIFTVTANASCKIIIPNKANITAPIDGTSVANNEIVMLNYSCVNPGDTALIVLINNNSQLRNMYLGDTVYFAQLGSLNMNKTNTFLFETEYSNAGTYEANVYNCEKMPVIMNSYECGQIEVLNSANTVKLTYVK